METIKQLSEQLANSFMPFITIGIERSAESFKEVRNGMARSIESLVRSEVEKHLREIHIDLNSNQIETARKRLKHLLKHPSV